MSTTDLVRARELLLAHGPSTLLGRRECTWLDAKQAPYQLQSPRSADELVKDVAAFANTSTGGMIVIGIATRKEHGEEILDEIRALPRGLVNFEQYRSLLRQRIVPFPRGIEVEWVPCEGAGDDEKGLVVIYVPAQPPASQLFGVPAPQAGRNAGAQPGGSGRPDDRSLAIPIRDADGTHWLPRTDIQRLVALGWATRSTDQSTRELAGLVREALDRPTIGRPQQPTFVVGRGETGWYSDVIEAREQFSAVVSFGLPSTEAYPDGPGVVQHFASAEDGPGWVLCTTFNHPPVVVSDGVWTGLRAAGAGNPFGSAVSAVGLPVIAADGGLKQRVIDDDVPRIELDGGSWGSGYLTRKTPDRPWQWLPKPRFSFDMTPSALMWTDGASQPELRVRALATLPVVDAQNREITPEDRQAFAASLPFSGLAGAITVLSKRRGADLPAALWHDGPNNNSMYNLSCSTSIAGSLGAGLTGEVMLAVPTSPGRPLVACADLRVESRAVWEEALNLAGGEFVQSLRRLSLEEIMEWWVEASAAVTELLPELVLESLTEFHWAAPPTLELRLTAEQSGTGGPVVGDLVDLSPFGSTDRQAIRQMAVTVTAPPVLATEQRRLLIAQAMVHLARGFGYVHADIARLR